MRTENHAANPNVSADGVVAEKLNNNNSVDRKATRPARCERKLSVCSLCGDGFQSKNELIAHYNVHSQMRRHVLYQRCVGGVNYASHMHEKLYECEVCKKILSYNCKTMRKHSRLHVKREQHICKVCKKGYATVESLECHLASGSCYKNFKCQVCFKSYRTSAALRHHENIHSGVETYKCGKCEMRFLSKSMLQRHSRGHDVQVAKEFQCIFCGKIFGVKYKLKMHERIHTHGKQYKCEICLKSFSQRPYLILHCRLHTGEKPLECAKCKRRFALPQTLQKHGCHPPETAPADLESLE